MVRRIHILGICLIGGLLPLLGASCRQIGAGPGSVPLAFRYDDFSGKSDTQLEQQIFALLARYDIPCTVAVIPDVCSGAFEDPAGQDLLPLSPAKADILRQGIAAGLIEVAQHGLTHQVQTTDGTRLSEFRDLSYDQQRDRIATGQAMLESAVGAAVRVFVPPWNTYDANTVAALEDLGFACLSGGSTGERPGSATLAFVPESADLDSVMQTVNGKRITNDGVPVVVLFHAYDFQESDPAGKMTLARFEQILRWVKAQSILRFRTVGQIAAERAGS